MNVLLPGLPPRTRLEGKSTSIVRTMSLVISLSLYVTPAAADYGYCFTQGLLGGTKVFIHDAVREADFLHGPILHAYRAELENAHRFRFGSVSCPSFNSEAEAREHFAATRTLALREGFVEFVFPLRRD